MLSDSQIGEIERKVSEDRAFKQQFDSDPVAALRAAGMAETADGLAQELSLFTGIAERLGSDETFAAQVDADPAAALVGAGLPAQAVLPFLQAAGAPAELIDRATPDTEAHANDRLTASYVRLVAVLAVAAPIAALAGWSGVK